MKVFYHIKHVIAIPQLKQFSKFKFKLPNHPFNKTNHVTIMHHQHQSLALLYFNKITADILYCERRTVTVELL